MITINNTMRSALAKAVDKIGGQSNLARATGLSQQGISKYISGHVYRMSERIWEDLAPYCAEFLPPGYKPPSKSAAPVMLKSDFDRPDSEVRSANGRKFRAVPVLSFAQAAGFEPALEPLCDYLRENTDRTQMFVDVPDTYFALEVSGDSMAPDYPSGSIALVAAGEFPERGDIVVAKLATGQVVIKEYHRKDNVVTLSSRNPAGQTFQWHVKEKPGFVIWMWPVIEIILKPREQRHKKMEQ